jgi:hypothetical protein
VRRPPGDGDKAPGTGGIFVRAYAGGLATALIFGLQAAATALASAGALARD